MQKIIIFIMCLVLVLMITGCRKTDSIDTPSIKLEDNNVEILIGETYILEPIVTGIDGTGIYECDIEDSSIIYIEDNIIIGMKPGKTNVSLYLIDYPENNFTFTVYVKEAIGKITGKNVVEVSQSITLAAEFDDKNSPIIWECTDKRIAKVEDGVVTGIKAGKVTIVAKCGLYTASIEITVMNKIHKVIFKDNLGNIIEEIEVEDGDTCIFPEDVPKIEGYVFTGWENIDLSNIRNSIEVVAVYKKIFNIRYELNGGEFKEGILYPVTAIEDKTMLLVNPQKYGYIFKGWSYIENGTEYITEIVNPTNDIVLYANWEDNNAIDIMLNYDGGISENLILANGAASGIISIDNYNYNDGEFWSGSNYANYVFIGDKNHDPRATFSYRAYIGKNDITGLYEVKSVLMSGGSTWTEGAEYVITISSHNSSDYNGSKVLFTGLEVGTIVVFESDITKATESTPVNVKFYANLPKNSIVYLMKTENMTLDIPSKLGFEFLGWFDENNNKITALNSINADLTITAKWKELSPVKEIIINNDISEIEYGKEHVYDAKVSPSDAYFTTILYSSSNENILTIDENGKMYAKNCGKATITISDFTNRVVVTKEITVNPIPSIEVSFDKEYNGFLSKGETIQLTAVSIGKYASCTQLKFESLDKNIAIVDENGLVTAINNGLTFIKITDNSGSGYELQIAIVVSQYNNKDKVDQVIELLKLNNYASVHYGNASLYNDGLTRYYDSIYGSVNNFLFDLYKVNKSYQEAAIANPKGHKLRRSTDTIEFVTVHDTATLTGDGDSMATYMSGNTGSIHYVTGGKQVYAIVPENYIGYHAGDGINTVFRWTNSGVKALDNIAPEFDVYKSNGKWYLKLNGEETKIEVPTRNGSKMIVSPSKKFFTELGPTWKVENGEYYIGTMWASFGQVATGKISSRGGNNNSVGIEMCVNTSGDIFDTYHRTAQLIADILIRNKLDLSRVKQHNTFDGKNCPQVIISGNYWDEFMSMVAVNYEMQMKFSDVEVSMKSNNPDILNNTGRIYNPPITSTTVSYDITVKCGEITKTVTFYSYVAGKTSWEQWDGTYSSGLIWNNGEFNKN